MPKIIVSYRRSDSGGMAGRIFDRLTQRYGDDSVFMDVDNIPFGTDFRTHIKGELLKSDLLVAVIGQRWLGVADARRRIDEATDPVRVEVETALREGVRVLPVLVDGARMPTEDELPDGLKDLAFINAAPVDTGRDFRQHMERVLRAMDEILLQRQALPPSMARAAAVPPAAAAVVPVPVAPAPSRSKRVWLAVPIALALLGAGVWAALSNNWFGGHPASPQKAGDPAGVRYPAFKGRVTDEPGFLHPETSAALTKKIADMESKTSVQVAVALLNDVPNGSPVEFADELSRRWKVGGEQRTGILLIIYPSQRRLTLQVGAGVQGIDRAVTNLIVQNVDRRLQANDVVGGLMQGLDDIIEVLTGDAKAWQARVSGAQAGPAPVAHPAPPPTTYRILPNVSGGVQNLRSGPATKYPIVVAIPAGATGITISICRNSEDGTRPWCAANWRNHSGWISSCCIVDEKTGAPPRVD